MEIKFKPFKKNTGKSNHCNCAILDYEKITSEGKNILKIIHSNEDDGYYSYPFEVTGTDDEIKVIKKFCDKLSDAT